MKEHDHDMNAEEAQDSAPVCAECSGRGYLTEELDGGGRKYACPDCERAQQTETED